VGQINIKNEAAAKLLDEVIKVTGQGKTEAVVNALELYLRSLDANKRAEAAIRLVREDLHPIFEPSHLGKAPSKREQEELLGL
jgi:hypothetical protein